MRRDWNNICQPKLMWLICTNNTQFLTCSDNILNTVHIHIIHRCLHLRLICISTDSPNVVLLRGEMFSVIGLDHTLMQQLYGEADDLEGIFTLTRSCCEESIATLNGCRDVTDDEFQLMVKSMPVRGILYSFSLHLSSSYALFTKLLDILQFQPN